MKKQFIRTKLNNFITWQEGSSKKIQIVIHCRPKALFLSGSPTRFSIILLIKLFCDNVSVKDKIFDTAFLSFLSCFIHFLNLIVSLSILRTLLIDRFNIRPCICPPCIVLPLCANPNFPPFSQPWRKKRKISRNRDYKLTLVEILKVSQGTSIVPPG